MPLGSASECRGWGALRSCVRRAEDLWGVGAMSGKKRTAPHPSSPGLMRYQGDSSELFLTFKVKVRGAGPRSTYRGSWGLGRSLDPQETRHPPLAEDLDLG